MKKLCRNACHRAAPETTPLWRLFLIKLSRAALETTPLWRLFLIKLSLSLSLSASPKLSLSLSLSASPCLSLTSPGYRSAHVPSGTVTRLARPPTRLGLP